MTGATREAAVDRRARHTVRAEMIMGLPFSIHLRGPSSGTVGEDIHVGSGKSAPENTVTPDEVTINAATERVWASLRWADRVFSTYRPDSNISRINRGELAICDADPAVAEVLDFADIARRITGGAFDIRGGGTLDPSGIVKSWATSRAALPLNELGSDYYLNAGGDVLLHSGSAHHPWRIGIEHPDDPQGLLAVVELASGAVATSGRTHRGEHIWNPVTSEPARGVAQATVIGPSLVWADILATAVVASGLDRVSGFWRHGLGELDMSQWPPGYEVLAVGDDGHVMATSGLLAVLASDVPAPPLSVLG